MVEKNSTGNFVMKPILTGSAAVTGRALAIASASPPINACFSFILFLP